MRSRARSDFDLERVTDRVVGLDRKEALLERQLLLDGLLARDRDCALEAVLRDRDLFWSAPVWLAMMNCVGPAPKSRGE